MEETPAPASRRDRKKQATRDSLHAAALELMSDRGFAGVTVETICTRADIAPSTFFRHFATKEDVVLSDFDERGRQLLDAIDAQPAGVGPAGLVIGAAQMWRLSRRPSEVLRAEALLLSAEPALQARLDRTIIGWEQPIGERLAGRYGFDAGSLDVRLAAAFFVTAIRVVIREWAVSGAEEDVFTLGAHGIGRVAEMIESMLGDAGSRS